MKLQTFRTLLAAIIMIIAACGNIAAQDADEVALGAIAPYDIEVTYDKTSHIIFPSGIRYVDLGSDNIVAGKAEDADNVLRVKASIAGFDEETNFSVITEDGHFYGFNVCYSDAPLILGHNIAKGSMISDRSKNNNVRFEELGATPASLSGLVMAALYDRDKKTLRGIKSESYGIEFSLKGLYVHNDKYYFHTALENSTNIPYNVDFIKFRIVDRKVAKRTVIQDLEIDPLRYYRPLLAVPAKNVEKNIIMLDVFTLNKGQMLEIELVEKNGGRGQVLKLKNSDLQQAQPLEKLRLKF